MYELDLFIVTPLDKALFELCYFRHCLYIERRFVCN